MNSNIDNGSSNDKGVAQHMCKTAMLLRRLWIAAMIMVFVTATLMIRPSEANLPKLTVTITSPTNEPEFTGVINNSYGFQCTTTNAQIPITYDWDWGDGTAHGSDEFAFHVYASAGAYGVTVTVTSNGQTASDSVTMYIIGGNISSGATKDLRYYCGAPMPARYQGVCTAASNQPDGTQYDWSTSNYLQIFSGQGSNLIYIEGAGASGRATEDVTLTYRRGSASSSDKEEGYTSFQPSSTERTRAQHFNNNAGYMSIIQYLVLDQFLDPLGDIDTHEEFGAFSSSPNYPNENWPAPSESGVQGTNGLIEDHLTAANDPNLNPQPQTPNRDAQGNLNNTPVQSGSQTWYAGSTERGKGCPVQTGTVTYYLDHADAQ